MEEIMIVAVSATAPSLDAAVDPRFGRAACFIMVNPATMDFQVIENKQNLNAPQGAGIQAAALVAGGKPSAVLTGHCGPKAFHTLQAAGIPVVLGVAGVVKDAVRKFSEGKYQPSANPDVEGHWV